MSMTYDQWKAQNIAAGGRGLRGVYDQWQASIPGSGVQQSAAPGELGGGTYGTTVDQVRQSGVGQSEDYERFQDPEVQQWLSRCTAVALSLALQPTDWQIHQQVGRPGRQA
jgi:hypothetical protein